MKILGITFTNDNYNITHVNFDPKLLQIEKKITQWRKRNLTLLGRITVIKSLLISKFVHLFTALPNPSSTEIKHLEHILFQFLWAGKRDPIKRAKVVQNYPRGGLRMLDLLAFVKSMKISWLKRLSKTNSSREQVAANEISNIQGVRKKRYSPLCLFGCLFPILLQKTWVSNFSGHPVQDILTYGSNKIRKICASINNPFWKNVLEAYAEFTSTFRPNLPQMLSENIWFSEYTKFKSSMVNSWNKNGVRFLRDLTLAPLGGGKGPPCGFSRIAPEVLGISL